MNMIHPRMLIFALILLTGYVVPLRAQGFDRYCNARYGFCVSYPKSFRMDPPPANDDGRIFRDGSGLVMTISGINNTGETLATEIHTESEGFDTVTQRFEGKNGFVLSGNKGTKVVYFKEFVGNGCINHLTIEYPARLKAKYGRVVAKVARSFKPGNLHVAH